MVKKNSSNVFLICAVLLSVLAFVSTQSALAGEYPRKPIRMIYPFPAGSGGDIGTRVLADNVSKFLKVPVKVSNVTGGRGTIGAATVARAKKDGYEIGSLPIGPALTQPIFSGDLPYQTADLEPVCQYTFLPIVIVANAKAPYKTVQELLAHAKKHPGQVKYAHPGLGTVPYMMFQAMMASSGVEMKGVPFKGLRPGTTAAVGGHVDVALSIAAGAVGLKKAGKINILGLFAKERMDLIPDVPTVGEVGVQDYPMIWTGIFVPKDTDPSAMKKLETSFAQAVKSEAFHEAMKKAKLPVAYLDRASFQKKIAADIEYFEAYKAKRQ